MSHKIMSLKPKPYWHKYNPWRDKLVYVSLEELAECVAGGTIYRQDESHVAYDEAYVLSAFRRYGKKLDAYLLPQMGLGYVSCGVRYGPAGDQYLSPSGHQDKIKALLQRKGINP